MKFPLQQKSFLVGNETVELVVPDAAAVKQAYRDSDAAAPYWSQVWPAAKALAQFLAVHTHYTRGKNVVELGAGLGLPSVVAARTAATVLCTDYVPEAVEVVLQSVARLHLPNIRAAVMNWQLLPPELDADVLLLSDVNYDPASFTFLQQLIQRFIEKDTLLILSTPQRLMAKEFIASLLHFCTHQEEVAVEQDGAAVLTTVLVLQQKQPA